jgi:hypothetical protein
MAGLTGRRAPLRALGRQSTPPDGQLWLEGDAGRRVGTSDGGLLASQVHIDVPNIPSVRLAAIGLDSGDPGRTACAAISSRPELIFPPSPVPLPGARSSPAQSSLFSPAPSHPALSSPLHRPVTCQIVPAPPCSHWWAWAPPRRWQWPGCPASPSGIVRISPHV